MTFLPRWSAYWWIWVSIAAIAVVDGILGWITNITIHFPGSALLLAGMLGGGTLFYGPLTNRSRQIFELLNVNALLFAIMATGLVLNYQLTWFGFPLIDRWLDSADRMLGFDWPAVTSAILGQPTLARILVFIYDCFMPEIFIVANWLALTGDRKRTVEFAVISLAAVVVCNLIFLIVPSDNVAMFYDTHFARSHDRWSTVLTGIRDHRMDQFTFGQMRGLITFPSFHTVMLVTLIYIGRGKRWFVAVLLFNGAMLVAVPTFGAHYLIDVLAGAAIALVLITATRFFTPYAIARLSRVPGP